LIVDARHMLLAAVVRKMAASAAHAVPRACRVGSGREAPRGGVWRAKYAPISAKSRSGHPRTARPSGAPRAGPPGTGTFCISRNRYCWPPVHPSRLAGTAHRVVGVHPSERGDRAGAAPRHRGPRLHNVAVRAKSRRASLITCSPRGARVETDRGIMSPSQMSSRSSRGGHGSREGRPVQGRKVPASSRSSRDVTLDGTGLAGQPSG
jgi:hypothetical protein